MAYSLSLFLNYHLGDGALFVFVVPSIGTLSWVLRVQVGVIECNQLQQIFKEIVHFRDVLGTETKIINSIRNGQQ